VRRTLETRLAWLEQAGQERRPYVVRVSYPRTVEDTAAIAAMRGPFAIMPKKATMAEWALRYGAS
jgi:hypothetical protein